MNLPESRLADWDFGTDWRPAGAGPTVRTTAVPYADFSNDSWNESEANAMTDAKQDECPFVELSKMKGYTTKDSGKREEMPTGSVRDTREGKGRFELISPFALRRLAGVYERGAAKYASRNWEKGQPFSRFLDSALRHLNSFAMGWTDEDHLSQALWNVAAIIHFQELGRADLDDMPHYRTGPEDVRVTGKPIDYSAGHDFEELIRKGQAAAAKEKEDSEWRP
jgi:hypothetical protein